jgi:hypothetical protein
MAENVFGLRFWRDDDVTRFETLKGDPVAVAQKRPPRDGCSALPSKLLGVTL